MMNLKQLVLASHNAGKLKELQAMLGESVQLRSIGEWSKVEPEETGLSFVENAILKARNAARISGLPALADDSGLCVDALDGAPGVLSARYATLFGEPKSDADNNRVLLREMQGRTDRRARFVSALVAVRHADDPEPLIAFGRWEGEITDAPRGTGGFGYNPVFLVPSLGLTAAEMTTEDKNRLSHRAIAAWQMLYQMREVWRLA